MLDYKIIVIGASFGAIDALRRVVAQLPDGLNAAVFVMLHIGSCSRSILPQLLSQAGALPAAHPTDGDAIVRGRIYVAPPDRHLVVEPGRIRLVQGPKENYTRPAVDPLFWSAALAYGPRVIGVVFNGNLDNGTAGLLCIKDRGGLAAISAGSMRASCRSR
jgi:two-component system chemotaxis response regulator CheB